MGDYKGFCTVFLGWCCMKSSLASSSSAVQQCLSQLCCYTSRTSEAGPLGVLAAKPTKLAVYCKSFTIKYSKIETEKELPLSILTFWEIPSGTDNETMQMYVRMYTPT